MQPCVELMQEVGTSTGLVIEVIIDLLAHITKKPIKFLFQGSLSM